MTRQQKRLRAGASAALLALTVAGFSSHYTVKPGDTLGEIADREGVSVAAIVAANDIADPDLIRVGQQLDIPESGSSSSSSADTRTYLVRAGDTLGKIAAENGLSVADLAAANGILDPSLIHVGATLQLTGTSFVAGGDGGSTAYTVQRGDTMVRIAARFGTSVSALAAANQIRNPDLVRTGSQLTVPAGGWVCPVADTSYINSWGFPRSGGRTHQGNDLFAPRNTPVLASVSGRVEQLTGSIGGNQYRLYGDDGNLYIGSHMESAGATGRVTAGTTIGYVGNSGNAAGANTHLHFELHPKGEDATNPYPTLQGNGC